MKRHLCWPRTPALDLPDSVRRRPRGPHGSALILAGALLLAACDEQATEPQRSTAPPDGDASVLSTQAATGDAPSLSVVPRGNAPVSSGPSGKARLDPARMLLYHSDNGSSAAFLENALVATGLFTPSDIDIVRMDFRPLGPPTFQEYTCVLMWTNFSPPNAVEQGDSLRAYADAGGRVVMATYAYSPLVNPWRMQGGIMEPGYSPMVNNNTRLFSFPRSLDFGTARLEHELLEGVEDFTYFGNSDYGQASLDPTASLIARDDFGVPLVAVSASDRVVGINLFPGGVFSKSPGVFRTLANACTARSYIEVDLDVRPGSDRNPVNLGASNGVLPVAILTSPEFDATTIDHTTLELEGAGETHLRGRSGEPVRHEEDVDGDGDVDLVLHVRIGETALGPTSEEATITGTTYDGTPIRGADEVTVIRSGRPR